jgi:L-amino acid N-acyltransferase YncA
VSVEEMRPADWPACARIYEEGLDVGTFEDEVPSWEEWDAAHLETPRLVARESGAVVGWAALAPYSERACYRGVVLNSVYVGWASRGRGVGRVLLEELVRRADDEGLWTIQASIFPENQASIALHASCGFRIVGTRERLAQKQGRWRDVVLMERRSPSAGL